jgi:hypothetical protein
MERNAALLASVSYFVITMAANGQPAFQGANEGPGANQIVDTSPLAARGLGVGFGGPPAQLIVPRTAPAGPTMTGCGTSTADANANNVAGQVSLTAGATATCFILFSTPYQSFNHCIVQTEASSTTASEISYSYSLTGINVFGLSALASTKFDYFCSGY